MTEIELFEIFSNNVRAFRKQNLLTQEKLAEKVDMSVQAINFFEGKRRFPSPESLVRIAEALNIEVYQLFLPQDKMLIDMGKDTEIEKIRSELQKQIYCDIRKSFSKMIDKLESKEIVL